MSYDIKNLFIITYVSGMIILFVSGLYNFFEGIIIGTGCLVISVFFCVWAVNELRQQRKQSQKKLHR